MRNCVVLAKRESKMTGRHLISRKHFLRTETKVKYLSDYDPQLRMVLQHQNVMFHLYKTYLKRKILPTLKQIIT